MLQRLDMMHFIDARIRMVNYAPNQRAYRRAYCILAVNIVHLQVIIWLSEECLIVMA